MHNIKHNLYKESLSARISRYEMTIQELKDIIEDRDITIRRHKDVINALVEDLRLMRD